MKLNKVINGDCLEAMKQMKDNEFDLAIVDPPYGININNNIGRRKGDKNSIHKKIDWDKSSPELDYFDEVFRVSKNQIIWGANHFISKMPFDSSCWLMWDKGYSEDVSFSQFELAWTSFATTCKKFDKNSNQIPKIHPTQKPVALYKWLLTKYANEGDTILDTHLGSGSSRIACYDLGFDFVGYELDKDYFELQEKRFEMHVNQKSLFTPEQTRVTI